MKVLGRDYFARDNIAEIRKRRAKYPDVAWIRDAWAAIKALPRNVLLDDLDAAWEAAIAPHRVDDPHNYRSLARFSYPTCTECQRRVSYVVRFGSRPYNYDPECGHTDVCIGCILRAGSKLVRAAARSVDVRLDGSTVDNRHRNG